MSQSPTLSQRPANDDKWAWLEYWLDQGLPWRHEPEIDAERQKYLTERRKIKPDRDQGNYPFRDIKLTRADVEWLLATHDNGRGPVNWSDESQRNREGLDLRGADLRGVDLSYLPFAGLIAGNDRIMFTENNLNEAWQIHLEGADLSNAHLEKANLSNAHLEEANLFRAHLEGADLFRAHLEGAGLYFAHLEGAYLRGAYFDSETRLDSVVLSNNKNVVVSLVDVHWGDVNVAVVDWAAVALLGEEQYMIIPEIAVRAYRQLAVVLHNQGLNEDAARFAYRAQLMQRKVFWNYGIRKFTQYLFSLFIDLLAGYGYKPWRSFAAYIVVICIFAAIYLHLGPHLAWNEAIVISMTAFHGRGFFPTQFQPGDPQALVAAIEAFVGLLIEVTFIATLTQRLFGK